MIGGVVVVAGGVLVVVTISVHCNGGRVTGVRLAGTGFEGLPMGRVDVVVTAAGTGAL